MTTKADFSNSKVIRELPAVVGALSAQLLMKREPHEFLARETLAEQRALTGAFFLFVRDFTQMQCAMQGMTLADYLPFLGLSVDHQVQLLEEWEREHPGCELE